MSQAKHCQSRDNQKIRMHYDMLIADRFNINISLDYRENSAETIARIMTVISTSQYGTDVEIKILKQNNEISFVRYNIPALKIDELKNIDLDIYHKPDDANRAESFLQWPVLKRNIKAHESSLTTYTALMFVIDVEQEIIRGNRRKKHSVFYFYSNAPPKQQIHEELMEISLLNDEAMPVSPTLKLPSLSWRPSDFQPEPFSDRRLLHPCDLSVLLLNKAACQVNLTYGLLLANHYQLDISAKFMNDSDEAVVRILTRIETNSQGSEVEIHFQKRNGQISFARFEIRDLHTAEFQDCEVDIKYDFSAEQRRGYTKNLTIPKSHNTTQIMMAYTFNVTTEGCTEPNVLYIFTKDKVTLPEEALTTSEDVKPKTFGIQAPRKAMTEFQQSALGKTSLEQTVVEHVAVKSDTSENLGPENSEPHFIEGQTPPKKKIKSFPIRDDQLPMDTAEWHSTETTNFVQSATEKTHEVNLVNADTQKPVPISSEEKIKLQDLFLNEHFFEKFFKESIKEDATTCVFNVLPGNLSSTLEQVMEKVKLGKNVIMNTYKITNNFNFKIEYAQNAVVGSGNINVHECSQSSHNSLEQDKMTPGD